jgi:hypothetical protein
VAACGIAAVVGGAMLRDDAPIPGWSPANDHESMHGATR